MSIYLFHICGKEDKVRYIYIYGTVSIAKKDSYKKFNKISINELILGVHQRFL